MKHWADCPYQRFFDQEAQKRASSNQGAESPETIEGKPQTTKSDTVQTTCNDEIITSDNNIASSKDFAGSSSMDKDDAMVTNLKDGTGDDYHAIFDEPEDIEIAEAMQGSLRPKLKVCTRYMGGL